MDITKWKSVAITVQDYAVLKSLCSKEFRAPAAFVSMLLKSYVEKQARGNACFAWRRKAVPSYFWAYSGRP